MTAILVWSEQPALLRDLLHKARAVAAPLGWTVAALALGPTTDFGPDGADVIVTAAADGAGPEVCTAALAAAAAEAQAGLVLVGATKLGLEVAARMAERRNAPYAPWATEIALDGATGAATVTCLHYTGTARATYHCQPGLAVVSAAAGAFGAQPAVAGAGQTQALAAALPAPRVTVTGRQPKAATGARLEDAHAVIDVGQGGDGDGDQADQADEQGRGS